VIDTMASKDCDLPPPPPPDVATVIAAARYSQPLELKAREFLTAMLQLCRDYGVSLAPAGDDTDPLPPQITNWNQHDESWLAHLRDNR
jgi:hypothetical protein